MIDISILMPAIRVEAWDSIYNSILKSTNRSFELVIISPYSLPKELEKYKNIKLIRDFGSPTRASQMAACLCEGKFIYPTHADDCLFIEDSLDKNINFLISKGENLKNAVICKYSESKDYSEPDRFQSNNYYKLYNAYPTGNDLIPKDWWIFNTVLMYREYFEYLGGFNAIDFEVMPYSFADLAIRAQRDGCNVSLSEFPLIRCGHGQEGHQPIEMSQIYNDAPLFREKYSKPLENYPIRVPLLNWKLSPCVWKKRF